MGVAPDITETRFFNPLFHSVGLDPVRVANVPKRLREKPTFIVPSGIGDIAWCYSKIRSLGKEVILCVADGVHPSVPSSVATRALPFLSLIEGVEYSGVALCTSPQVVWAAKNSSLYRGKIPETPAYFSCNSWLESGRTLDNFLPELPTVRNFKMFSPSWASREADMLLEQGEEAFAIYPSSRDYFGNENIPVSGWFEMARRLSEASETSKIVLIGATWDVSMLFPLREALAAVGLASRTVCVFDRTFATSLEILKRCKFLVAAASGLGIVAEFQGIPTVHLYPPHLYEGVSAKAYTLMGTWETPDMVKAGTSLSLKMGKADKEIPIENTQERVDGILDSMFRKFSPLR